LTDTVEANSLFSRFQGKLRGVDQTYNLILEDTYERVFSASAGVETVKLGLYIIRGDNVATVGELDAATDASLNWADFTAEPLGPIVH